jgi:hypothetical protein
VFYVSPKNTSLFLLEIFSTFYKCGATVNIYILAFLFYLNSTMYCLGNLIKNIFRIKCHQLSWDLDLLQSLIYALCINNGIMILRVGDDVEGVISLIGNGDVMV